MIRILFTLCVYIIRRQAYCTCIFAVIPVDNNTFNFLYPAVDVRKMSVGKMLLCKRYRTYAMYEKAKVCKLYT